LGTLGGSFSIAYWLNNAGESVGGATTSGDALFHATHWKNGAITDLGTLDGDCFSQAWAINSKGQIVGQSFSCDFSTVRTVLWDKGSIFDLGIASTEPLNINDPGEITGVYLPAGCDNSDLCSHAFVLVPCNNAGVQGCDIMVQPNPAAIAIRAGTTPADAQKTRELTAKWRARLAQRHTVLGIGRSRN
jgi:probable HAF family extracellular repeat protein